MTINVLNFNSEYYHAIPGFHIDLAHMLSNLFIIARMYFPRGIMNLYANANFVNRVFVIDSLFNTVATFIVILVWYTWTQEWFN